MATYPRQYRSGLPRTRGGLPWPAIGETEVPPAREGVHSVPRVADVSRSSAGPLAESSSIAAGVAEHRTQRTSVLRQGLPRVRGGAAWPPIGAVPAVAEAPVSRSNDLGPTRPVSASPASAQPDLPLAEATSFAGAASLPAGSAVRQGLPRHRGGAPWPPPANELPAIANIGTRADSSPVETSRRPPAVEPQSAAVVASPTSAPTSVLPDATIAPAPAPNPEMAPALSKAPLPPSGRSLSSWIRLIAIGAVGSIVAAGVIVLAARGLTTLPGVPEFLARYHGSYAPPFFVEPGFPAWVRWSHFLNFFLIVLIIRSGLLVRHQERPPAYITLRRSGRKISMYVWMHTTLDVLWLANGIIFVVLMFVSGHWARVVPTSWEVFPHAASALLQYLTLEWPVESGWVNYNSLQQLMYFLVIFVAAPIAAITGVRMSQWWPERATRLNRIYPVQAARAVHFPTMLFFVLFIIGHVTLVFATGALRNLNNMYAGTPDVSWTGFFWFVGGLVLVAAAVWAARPLVLLPVMSLFGKVSQR